MTPTEAHAHAMNQLGRIVESVRHDLSEGLPVDHCVGYVAHNAMRLAEESFADLSERLAKALDRIRTLELVVAEHEAEIREAMGQ